MKKIACVLGSPRKGGNSESIAKSFIESAKRFGAEAQTFALNDLNFRGCQACMACKTGAEDCVLNDDLAQVLAAIKGADIVILATPVYFAQVTGPMKSLIDRMYSFLTPTYMTGQDQCRLTPGKKLVFISTQGSPDPEMFDAFAPYSMFFSPQWFGCESHVIRGVGLSSTTDAAADDSLMDQAADLAVRLIS